ncbi:MAG: Fe-S-cluster containining protein [Limisphaerales bacterium]|jgi:Fe-S-cluster containining protein
MSKIEITEIEHWKKQRLASKKPHKQLLKQLDRKKGNKLDDVAEELHKEAFTKISCLDCANCCSTISPIVTLTDIKNISKYIGMKPGDFKEKYIIRDDEGDYVMNSTPCPFLGADNYCEIYDERPRACREYPHTDAAQFSAKIKLHNDNAQYCPAVFYILENIKEKMGINESKRNL